MENCIMCGMEISDFDVCSSCSGFLRCKYGERYDDRVIDFRKHSKKGHTKCYRRKK